MTFIIIVLFRPVWNVRRLFSWWFGARSRRVSPVLLLLKCDHHPPWDWAPNFPTCSFHSTIEPTTLTEGYQHNSSHLNYSTLSPTISSLVRLSCLVWWRIPSYTIYGIICYSWFRSGVVRPLGRQCLQSVACCSQVPLAEAISLAQVEVTITRQTQPVRLQGSPLISPMSQLFTFKHAFSC